MTSQNPNQWQPPRGSSAGWNQASRGTNPQWATPQSGWSPYGPTQTNQYPSSPGMQQYQSPTAPRYLPVPQPKKRGRSLLGLLIIGAVFFLLVPVIIGIFADVLSGLGQSSNFPDTNVPGPTAPSATATTEPGVTPTQPTSGYYHDDYQVPNPNANPPELPAPTTYDEASNWMTSNDFYAQPLSVPVRCDISAINLSSASKGELEQHFNELTECLVRVFGPAMNRSGFELVRPQVVVYSSPVQSPCGQMPDANAAYCMADQRIYYSTKLPRILPPNLRGTEFVVESVLAHEFAHSIQGRTGILISEMAWQSRVNESDALELSRRTEVQSDCWAGMFNQAVAQSINLSSDDNQNVREMFYNIGDDVLTQDPNYVGNHGHGASRVYWYDLGFANDSLGTCNAFIASPETVR